MKTRRIITAAILCLFAGATASAQVNIRESIFEEFGTVNLALQYMQSNLGKYIETDNGTVHIDISGNISESEYSSYIDNVINLPSSIKKVVISSTSSAKHTVTVQRSDAYSTYVIRFQNKDGEVEVSNLTFAGQEFAWIASTASTESDATSRSWFHDCIFKTGYTTRAVDNNSSEFSRPWGTTGSYQSDIYQFEDNIYEYGINYIFNSNPAYDAGDQMYKQNASFIFRDNMIQNFRGISIVPLISDNINVEMIGNKFYHLQSFKDCTFGSSICLCQVTGPLAGSYTFTGNKILGLFKAFDDTSDENTCALLLQHGNAGYQGITDDSSITIKDNTIQCDVLEIAWKAGTGSSYDTGSVKEDVLAGDYYNLQGDSSQNGAYTAVIENNQLVHMYPEEGATHDEDDACHICKACGQTVIRAEVAGHGGTFQYIGEDDELHDVNSAVTSISKNLYPEIVAPGVDIYDKMVSDLTRDGFCIEPGMSQEFVITPNLPGAFTSLKFYGRADVADLTADTTTADEGKTYNYTFTNDFKQANPYIECPVLIAYLGYGGLKVSCSGLDAGESAMFDVKDPDGKIIFIINLTKEADSKTISGLQPGLYKVTPHNISGKNWQWTYDMTPSTEQTKTVVVDSEVSVAFTVAKKSLGTTSKNGEAYKDNKLHK